MSKDRKEGQSVRSSVQICHLFGTEGEAGRDAARQFPHGARSLEQKPAANSRPALSRSECRIKIHQVPNESAKRCS